MQAQQPVSLSKSDVSITKDFINQMQQLLNNIYANKLVIREDTMDKCKTIVTQLLRYICVKVADSSKEERQSTFEKTQYEIVRDCVIYILIRFSRESLETASFILKMSLNHLGQCRSCTETLIMLNILCIVAKNIRTASMEHLVYNRLVDLIGVLCESSAVGTAPFYLRARREVDSRSYSRLQNHQEPVLSRGGSLAQYSNELNASAIGGRKISETLLRTDKKEGPLETKKEAAALNDTGDNVNEENKYATASNMLRHNYYQIQIASRSMRRRQNRNPAEVEGNDFNAPNNERTNHNLSTNNITTSAQPNSRPTIPKLNIGRLLPGASPTGQVQTRSSRRADATKSASTRATHYSTMFSSSFDYFHTHSGIIIHK